MDHVVTWACDQQPVDRLGHDLLRLGPDRLQQLGGEFPGGDFPVGESLGVA
jgi:hypothetical protein